MLQRVESRNTEEQIELNLPQTAEDNRVAALIFRGTQALSDHHRSKRINNVLNYKTIRNNSRCFSCRSQVSFTRQKDLKSFSISSFFSLRCRH